MISFLLLLYAVGSTPIPLAAHDPDYDAITTPPSGSYERIKAKAQEALFHATAPYRKNIDFIKLKKRHMFYGTKMFDPRWTPGFQFLNSSEFFQQEGATPKSPAQVLREKEMFLAQNPDYKNEKAQYYDQLMQDKNVFLDNEDIVKYRNMIREKNLGVTVDWNRFRRYTNTTYPPEDPLSEELHRIHVEHFGTINPLQQLEDVIRRKAEQYREQKRRENRTKSLDGKVVSYRYVRRPKVNTTYLYGKADIIDSEEYVKQLIDRRPKDPENSEDPDFIKYCLNRGYSFGFHDDATLRLTRNFTIPHFNLNREKVLDLQKSSEINPEEDSEKGPDHTIDEGAVRAQYSNEVDALKKLKSLEAKRVEKLMKQVNKLKSRLKSTTTEKSVWMNHPMILNRLFEHKIVVDRCIGDDFVIMPTTIDFHKLYEMHRNTRTTDVSLLSREILRGQDTLQASQYEKYLAFMRKHRNNSALTGQELLYDELRARNPNVFEFVQNGVEYVVNNSREVIDLIKQDDENRAREMSSSETNYTTEMNIWEHWETSGSTTEHPFKLKMEVLYKEPPSYSYHDSQPWHNTSAEVELLWKKYKKEKSPDYTYDETAFPMVTRSTVRTTTHRPAPWQDFLTKLATIDLLDRRIPDTTTPEYDEQHARVMQYDAPDGKLVQVHEIGFKSHEAGPDIDFDERNLVDQDRYDEANKAHQMEASNVVHLDASDGKSYMDLDPEEAVAGTVLRSSLTTLKWRAITRRTEPSTPEAPRTKAAWYIKSSQRYHQRLVDRKRWEIEKIHRTSTPNISTRLPVGILHEDDLYYDEGAIPAFDIEKARQQLEGTTSSYEVGTFENLPYVEKKNVLRASIKRQRALNEYWSRKFSVTTLHPPTRRTFNYLKVSSARYHWGAMHHTFRVHYMNSSEAFEDDKRLFYGKLGLNKTPRSKSTIVTSTQSNKKTKTKKTKAPTTTGITKSTTSFPIPLNGSYEEWYKWNRNLKEENNLISWYSDTSERVWMAKKNRSLYTPYPIERSGVYYESGSRDYPVNCSLSLETDVPEPADQWKQFEKWQKDRFTRTDLTFESLEEPPYEKLPVEMRSTLDSRAHQITLYPRVTTPSLIEDSSEEWDKLNLAIPARTKPPRNATVRRRRSVGCEQSLIETVIAPTVVEEPFRKQYSAGLIVQQKHEPLNLEMDRRSFDPMVYSEKANDRVLAQKQNYKRLPVISNEGQLKEKRSIDTPSNLSETENRIPAEASVSNDNSPPLLNLERLVRYLETLNRNNVPKEETITPNEQVMLDNLKDLFAYLKASHVKQSVVKHSYSGNKRDQESDSTEVTPPSLVSRASQVEFKNNIMDMPSMKEMKNLITNKITELNKDEDSEEKDMVKELIIQKMKKKDVVHILDELFQHIRARKVKESKNLNKKQEFNQDFEQSSSTFLNHLLNTSSVSVEYHKGGKTNNEPDTVDEINNGSIKNEEVHYNEDSKQLNGYVSDHIPLNYSSDDYVKTKPDYKFTLTTFLCSFYDTVIDIIRALFVCIDAVVNEFDAIKFDVRAECVALKQKAARLIDSIYFFLRVEENVMNLMKYMKLQENNATIFRLHRLKRELLVNTQGVSNGAKYEKENVVRLLNGKEYEKENSLNNSNGKEHEKENNLNGKEHEKENGVHLPNGKKHERDNGGNLANGKEYQNVNGKHFSNGKEYQKGNGVHLSNRKEYQKGNGVHLSNGKEYQKGNGVKLANGKENEKENGVRHLLNDKEHQKDNGVHLLVRQNVFLFLLDRLKDIYNLIDWSVDRKITRKRMHRKTWDEIDLLRFRRKRDVVYTYSDESTVDPNDQWYIDLAAREFVQGRDKNDPNYNRSKFIKNLKRSGIFSYGNFSKECLSNKTWPTIKPPTTWSRNFSIRYQPCTFWNWTRYLQVHSSYMEFLFGTGTPLTTKKKKRNLTAKRMRAHQDFLNRFSPKTTLKWPSTVWLNTTDWSAMESYVDKVLKIKGIDEKEEEDYFTLNSELRRISSIVWQYTETTKLPMFRKKKKTDRHKGNSTRAAEVNERNPNHPEDSSGDSQARKMRKKNPKRPEDDRSDAEESDVYYDEMERHSTTEHVPDWEYADRMFRHWQRIKD